MDRTDQKTPVFNRRYKLLILLLISLLIANPAILFLLTRNILVSIFMPVLVLVIFYFSYFYSRSKLVTIYLVNLFAIISFFGYAEVIFTNNFHDYVIEDLYINKQGYYFNKPNLNKRFEDKEYAADYLTNCQGYRIPSGQDPQDKVDTADWLFIGDSFTQGAQVNFEQLYTTLVYKRNPNKIVINTGISGAGIAEEYNYYHKEGYLLKSSLVALQICSFNDFMNVEPARRAFTDYLAHYSNFIRFLLQGFKYQNAAQLPLGRWTEPFQPDLQSNRDYNIFYREESLKKKTDLELFRRYLRIFNDEIKKQGSRLIVFLIPTKEQVEIGCFQEVITAFQIQPNELDMLRPNKLLRQFTDELDITFVDMLEPFRSARSDVFFDDDEHLTISGHEVLAEELSKVMPKEPTPPPILLSKEYAGDRYPTYSSDGTMITYQSPINGKMEIFLANQEFNNNKRLTANNVNECHPMMSRDGARLTFTEGDPETFQTKVQVADINDINKRIIITKGDDVFGAIPCFSPDDKFLAYAEWQRISKTQYSNPQIVTVNLTTNEKRYLTKADHESWRPVFSPDGKRLAYIAKYQKQFDLYLCQIESGREDRITWTPFDEWDPHFSPDGRYIVYSAKPDGNWDLFVYDLKIGETYRLTRSKGDEWDASFSPTGDRVIYAGRFGLIEGIYEKRFSPDKPSK